MTCAASADAFDPVALRAEEAISEPFRFTVDMLSSNANIDADTLLGHPACVTLVTPSGAERHFHGIVRSFSTLGPHKRSAYRYRVELVPKFWFASQTADCRIFQNLTVVEILQKLFQENGVEAEISTKSAAAMRPYTAQYNETDYDFAIRLMEEEGYFWYFTHTASAHKLVLADANTSFVDAPQPVMNVVPASNAPDVLSVFTRASATAFGKFKLADYDPLNPSTPVEGEQATILRTTGKATRDVYRFPALTTVSGTATSRARLRQEAAEASATLCHGEGCNPGFSAGKRFKDLNDPLAAGAETVYVVRRIVHEVQDDADNAGAGTDSYANSLDAFPVATAWRDWPRDRRPSLAGIHTAIVVGNEGEEIHTDQYGRIKVRFFWDHRAEGTANDSIFIRMMQPWSGNTWGWQHLPRVGTEVAVAFVNGDPDSPIVVGCLYNAEQMPVFPLPAEQTKSGLRTRSSTNGGTADFNEWSFDDKKGSELVFFHAQKDFTEEVENDHSTHVMHDQTLKVDNIRIHEVGKTEDITIGDAQTIKIGNGRTTTINQADESLTVDPGNITIKASSGAIAQTAMKGYTIKSSSDSVKISAAISIELSVGANSIKIDNSGVAINGTMLKLAGTAMVDMNAPMTKVAGSGMLMLKGGLVMIN